MGWYPHRHSPGSSDTTVRERLEDSETLAFRASQRLLAHFGDCPAGRKLATFSRLIPHPISGTTATAPSITNNSGPTMFYKCNIAMKEQRRDPFYRDPSAAKGAAANPSEAAVGEFVAETFEYDGGRQVTVYVPPRPPEAIVFAGDGQRISKWGRLLEMADLPSTMIVGVHGSTDEMLRLHEYSPVFEPVCFAAHEKFFVEYVRQWTDSRFGVALPPERTAVFGVSAGGELALALGLRHPGIYGAVFCASPGGGYKPPAVLPNPLPRTYLVAGTLEPFFLDNAKRWADALRHAGADVVMNERIGSHGGAFWREEFPMMVSWAFGR